MNWLLRPLGWLFAWQPRWRDAVGTLVLTLRHYFYTLLATAFVIGGAVDQFVHPFTTGLSNASFDWLMRTRPIAYSPDKAIMVLDIDEASLAEMNPEFGRWPWPRELLGRVAGRIEAAGAQAVMFDILFADQDIANPHSEEAFDRYVQGSKRSFYPLVRLNPQNDGASEIKVADLNFVEREPAAAAPVDRTRTIALLAPYFKSIYDTTRLGTNNIEPDADNVIRLYPNYEVLAGYRIPSLPYRVGRELGWPRPAKPRERINWPRAFTGYTTIPFARVYQALQTSDSGFFAQFKGRAVLIGSTAPSLNDIKATPVDSALPGVYVLATALDNIKHSAFLRPLPRWFIWGVEIALLSFAAWLFSHPVYVDRVSQQFLMIPTVLVGLALLSVSVSTVLFDLTVPIATLLTYFAAGQLFRKSQNDFVAGTESFAFTPREIAGRSLEVATLPEAYSRDAVLTMIRAHVGTKLWEPADLGLGHVWLKQGWLLWRWSKEEPADPSSESSAASSSSATSGSSPPSSAAPRNSADDPVMQLQWARADLDAKGPHPSGLAQAIARAMRDNGDIR